MHWIKNPLLSSSKAGLHKLLGLVFVVGITVALMSGVLGCEEKDLVFGHAPTHVQGSVLDSFTLQSIDSVAITIFDTAATSTPDFTDSLGSFQVNIGGNPTPVFFRKPGYETKLVRANDNDTLTVLLAQE